MTNLAFPAQEFEDRLVRIRAKMKAQGLDALVLTRPQNIYYATGYKGAFIANQVSELHCAVIPAQGEPRMMTRVLEAETAKRQWTKAPRLYMDHENPYAMAADMVKESGSDTKVVGIEERFLKLSQYKRLTAELSKATFKDASGLIEPLAASPSPAETACMRKAARVTQIGFETGIKESKEGVYPYEVIAKIQSAMYGAGQSDFDMSLVAIWSGPQGGAMHDTDVTEKLKKGDIATIEIMGVDNQYRAGSQTAVYIGSNPPENIVKAYKMVADMHEAARKVIKAGVTAGSVFDAANAVYRAARGKDYYRRVGGSMGLTLFTLDLVKNKQDVLTPGVSLLIQTLVDDPVLLCCASTVVVTEKGYEELTKPILDMPTTG